MFIIVVVVLSMVSACRAKFVIVVGLYGPRLANVSVLVLVKYCGRRSRCSCRRVRLRVRCLFLRSIRACSDLHLMLVLCVVDALSPRSNPEGGGFPALPLDGGVARPLGCSCV